MKTLCCDYDPPVDVPYPVMWNEFNKVVQCHNCGEVWTPISRHLEAYKRGQEHTMKWVSEECKRQTERLNAAEVDKLLSLSK